MICNAVMKLMQSKSRLKLYAPSCGLIQWGPMAVFYEPLLWPLNRYVKSSLGDILQDKEAWMRCRRALIDDSDYSLDEGMQRPLDMFIRGGAFLEGDPGMSSLLGELANTTNLKVRKFLWADYLTKVIWSSNWCI